MSTPVTLERYAEMRAEMDAGRMRDEVLARAGLSAEEWTGAQRAWLEKMGTELERGRFDLTNRYTQAFLERQRALTADAPRAKVAAPIAPPAITPPPIAPPAITPPPIAPRAVVPFRNARWGTGDPTETIVAGLDAGEREAIPFKKALAQDPSAAGDQAQRMLAPPDASTRQTARVHRNPWDQSDPTDTIAAPLDIGKREAMPFRRDPRTHADPTETIAAPLTSSSSEALPFTKDPWGKDVSASQAAPPATKATMRLQIDPAQRARDETLESTAALPAAAVKAARDALPFAKDPWGKASSTPPGSKDTMRLPLNPAQPTGDNKPLQPAPIAHPGVPPNPPGLSGPPDPPGKRPESITLAEYADICAALTAFPEQVVQIRSHHGMDAHAWMALHALWEDRFQRNPPLRARWEAQVEAALARRRR